MSDKRDGKWMDLRPDSPLAEASRHTLLVRLQVVTDYRTLVLNDDANDPENVHQLRVATRRAGAALRIFRHTLLGNVFRRVRKRLRQLRRAAGSVRDWDVFLENLQLIGGERPLADQPGLAFLVGHAFSQRILAQSVLQETVRKKRSSFEWFLHTVAATPASPSHTPAATLADMARPLLSGLLEELDHALAGNLDDHPHLHQVRIAGKRLRYAMEIFVDCHRPEFREVLYPLVEEVQEILGTLNDSHVAVGRLACLGDRLQSHPFGDWPPIAPGIDGVLRWHDERMSQKKQSFHGWLKRWRQADAAALLSSLAILPAGERRGVSPPV